MGAAVVVVHSTHWLENGICVEVSPRTAPAEGEVWCFFAAHGAPLALPSQFAKLFAERVVVGPVTVFHSGVVPAVVMQIPSAIELDFNDIAKPFEAGGDLLAPRKPLEMVVQLFDAQEGQADLASKFVAALRRWHGAYFSKVVLSPLGGDPTGVVSALSGQLDSVAVEPGRFEPHLLTILNTAQALAGTRAIGPVELAIATLQAPPSLALQKLHEFVSATLGAPVKVEPGRANGRDRPVTLEPRVARLLALMQRLNSSSIWGRDLIAATILALRGDEVVELQRRCGLAQYAYPSGPAGWLGALRREWFEFVVTADLRRGLAAWSLIWRAADVRVPPLPALLELADAPTKLTGLLFRLALESSEALPLLVAPDALKWRALLTTLGIDRDDRALEHFRQLADHHPGVRPSALWLAWLEKFHGPALTSLGSELKTLASSRENAFRDGGLLTEAVMQS